MSAAQVGGALLIAASVLLAATTAATVAGMPVGIGLPGLGGLSLEVSLASLGVGTALLGVAGGVPLDGRTARIGSVMAAAGMFSVVTGSTLASLASNDPMESLPILALLFAGGWIAAAGVVLTVAGLFMAKGPSRWVSLAFIGAVPALVGSIVVLNGGPSAGASRALISVLGALAIGGLLAGTSGIGMLALRSNIQRNAS